MTAASVTSDDVDPGAGQRVREFGMQAALLRELDDSGGAAPWGELQEKLRALGRATFWELAKVLVGMHNQGRVHAAKIGGRTYVSLPIGGRRA